MNTDEILGNFIDEILHDKNFGDLEPEIYAEMKADFMQQLETRIQVAIFTALPKDKLDTFDAMTETASDAEIQEFCAAHVPNMAELLTKEMLEFRRLYIPDNSSSQEPVSPTEVSQ